ncbi:MAG: hypothetical protein ACRYFX_12065 [Janthinobacterium lividum]
MQLAPLFTTLLLTLLHYVPGPNASVPRYQTEDTLAPYVGTWVGHTPTGEFKLVLEERKQFHIGTSNLGDIIVGWHAYATQDGPVNESLSLPANKFVLICLVDDDNPGGIFGSFGDGVNRKSVNIRMSFTNAAKTQLSWVIVREKEAFSFDPAKPVLPGVSVPSKLILTKVK